MQTRASSFLLGRQHYPDASWDAIERHLLHEHISILSIFSVAEEY